MKAFTLVAIALFAVCFVDAAPKERQQRSGPFCSICESVVKMVEQYLNQSEGEIEGEIDQYVCSELPQSFQTACDDFVKEFLPTIISYLEDGESPEDICKLLRVC